MPADRITRLAAAVADSRLVDWDDARRQSSDHDGGLVEELRIIAAVAELHAREIQEGASPVPERWGSLTVIERLGGGSFGEVFRARDPRLDRDVALKLFRTSHEPDAALIREGRLLARVRHPNVVTVYGADDRDGRTGVWMELVQGRTLQQIVEADGALGAREAVGIGIDLCRALAAVHRAGLLHRDIKPHNVMRERGGRIVLMDFGTSREHGVRTEDDSAGTPLYLAPELLDGGRATSQSDIFSLGALIFYVLSGESFVAADSVATLRAAHAAGRRRLLRDVRPDLPDRLIRVVERALSPDPGNRFASAGAMEAALSDALLTGAADGRPRRARVTPLSVVLVVMVSIAVAWLAWHRADGAEATLPFDSVAVLPFVPLSSATPDYLVVGITDGLIRDASRVAGIRVISRTTALYYRGKARRVTDIARELGVGAVVEGSIAQEGERLTLRARLVDARQDRTVWSGERVGTVAELPSLERSLAAALVARLGSASPDSGQLPTASSYEQYLKGRAEWNKRTPDGLTSARRLFEASVADSPLYAEAHAGLAATYLLLGAFDVLPKPEMFPRARASAGRALAIDDGVAEAHAVLGYMLFEQRERDAAFREFKRAIDLDPSNPTARQWYALSLVGSDPGEAVRQIRIAHDLDPLSMPVTSDLAVIYRLTGRNDEAIAHLARVTLTFPEYAEGHRQLGWAFEAAGRHRDAAQAFSAAVQAGAATPENVAAIGFNLAAAGNAAGARAMLVRLGQLRETRAVSWTHEAAILCALGDPEGAIAALQRAEAEHQERMLFETFVGTLRERPRLAVLWEDPRFVAMVRRRVPWLLTERDYASRNSNASEPESISR